MTGHNQLKEIANSLGDLEGSLGVDFSNKELLVQAMMHRSYLNEHRGLGIDHNERLEFLGDAVLELIVTHHLYQAYPQKAEGELTAYRAALVNTTMLARVASEIKLNDYLLLSRGEAKDTGRARQYILANTFEAFIGALYLDQGYDAVGAFLETHLLPLIDEVITHRLWQDAKSRFQEVAQDKVSITPSYETVSETGPDHDKQFVVGIYIGDEKVAEGQGRSKQEAEQSAARKALETKGWG